jgi:hypothetical protein
LRASVRLLPESEPPTQDQAAAVYPEGPVSESAYVPTLTLALDTERLPVAPVIVLGPAALSMKSAATLLPPLLFVMVFTKVSFGEISALLIVQVAFWLRARTKLFPVSVPAVQLHAPAL